MLTLLAAATVLTAAPTPRPAALCPPPKMTQARVLRPQDLRGDAGTQTLGSLPRARMEFTVSRDIAGCTVPAVVREDVQGDGRFARPR